LPAVGPRGGLDDPDGVRIRRRGGAERGELARHFEGPRHKPPAPVVAVLRGAEAGVLEQRTEGSFGGDAVEARQVVAAARPGEFGEVVGQRPPPIKLPVVAPRLLPSVLGHHLAEQGDGFLLVDPEFHRGCRCAGSVAVGRRGIRFCGGGEANQIHGEQGICPWAGGPFRWRARQAPRFPAFIPLL
jgi:hypothetical protein